MEITNELREIAEEILKSGGDVITIELEHDNEELNWVEVSLSLCVRQRKMESWIRTQSKTIMDSEDNCNWVYIHNPFCHSIQVGFDVDVDAIAKHIIDRVGQVETLIFDKYNGKFIDGNDKDEMRKYNIEGLRHKVFADKKSLQHKNKCSVCYDHTLTTTPCGHDICLPCWEKLDKKKCPCCREDIQYKYKNDEDDD